MSILVMPFKATAEAVQEPDLNWVEGSGQQVRLTDIAELTLPQDYFFLDKDDTIAFIKSFHDLPSYNEIGYVEPADENAVWSVYFEYAESGHIEDNEKSDIDADELLKSYERGQEEANKKLPESNQLFVDGWFKEPAYDESVRSLTWALLLHNNNGEKIINYNVRILTRVGYISAILVSTPENLEADRNTFEQELLPHLSVTSGNTYADFDSSTDKKSALGLTGLILGGAGIVTAKRTGLLAIIALFAKKLWFIILAPFLWIGKLFKRKNKKGHQQTDYPSAFDSQEDNRFKTKFDAENEQKKPPTSL
ncbi:DUF2167 domain-containing protein [Paenibacillus sp. A14]